MYRSDRDLRIAQQKLNDTQNRIDAVVKRLNERIAVARRRCDRRLKALEDAERGDARNSTEATQIAVESLTASYHAAVDAVTKVILEVELVLQQVKFSH